VLTQSEIQNMVGSVAAAEPATLATVVDSDGDGLSDDYEISVGFDPLNPDSDGDEIWDGGEMAGDITHLEAQESWQPETNGGAQPPADGALTIKKFSASVRLDRENSGKLSLSASFTPANATAPTEAAITVGSETYTFALKKGRGRNASGSLSIVIKGGVATVTASLKNGAWTNAWQTADSQTIAASVRLTVDGTSYSTNMNVAVKAKGSTARLTMP
jgi:hypothetical protein